jgi:circadian clock protein KaiC
MSQERVSTSALRLGSLPTRVSSGVPGLDEVLGGGLISQRSYLVRGGPGTGKTTLGLHFLTAGASQGESTLFISLTESEAVVRQNALRMGFDLTGVSFLDLSPTADFFVQVESYDLFTPADVEREPVTRSIVSEVEELRPRRVFVDSMSQLRYLSSDTFQYRKQVVSFLRFLMELETTALFASEAGSEAPDEDLQFLSDGVIDLQSTPQDRALRVVKFRGSDFQSGWHAMRLSSGGASIYPKLLPGDYGREFTREAVPSGVPELDELLHGGLERGTITILSGPSGAGKTTMGLLFMKEAAGRGERSVVYSFEEEPEVLMRRSEAINIPVLAMMQRGTLAVIKVEPMRYSPDEFARMVRDEVEAQGTRIVMLDSVSGYKLSLRGDDLVTHIHALAKYMANMGVTVLLVNEVEAITGDFRATEVGISYLADNIIFFRYLELRGEIHKAIGVLKKRLSDFGRELREIEITRYGVKVGAPLAHVRGVLTGTPVWLDSRDEEG